MGVNEAEAMVVQSLNAWVDHIISRVSVIQNNRLAARQLVNQKPVEDAIASAV